MQWQDCAVWPCQTWRRRLSIPASPALAARTSYSLLNPLASPLNPLTRYPIPQPTSSSPQHTDPTPQHTDPISQSTGIPANHPDFSDNIPNLGVTPDIPGICTNIPRFYAVGCRVLVRVYARMSTRSCELNVIVLLFGANRPQPHTQACAMRN